MPSSTETKEFVKASVPPPIVEAFEREAHRRVCSFTNVVQDALYKEGARILIAEHPEILAASLDTKDAAT